MNYYFLFFLFLSIMSFNSINAATSSMRTNYTTAIQSNPDFSPQEVIIVASTPYLTQSTTIGPCLHIQTSSTPSQYKPTHNGVKYTDYTITVNYASEYTTEQCNPTIGSPTNFTLQYDDWPGLLFSWQLIGSDFIFTPVMLDPYAGKYEIKTDIIKNINLVEGRPLFYMQKNVWFFR